MQSQQLCLLEQGNSWDQESYAVMLNALLHEKAEMMSMRPFKNKAKCVQHKLTKPICAQNVGCFTYAYHKLGCTSQFGFSVACDHIYNKERNRLS